jgi:hypothetical protein
VHGEEDVEALVDDSEVPQLEANEKAAAAAALACVLQHMQPTAAPLHQPEQDEAIGEHDHEHEHEREHEHEQQKQQQSSARQVDPRVLRADRLKGTGGSALEHRSSMKPHSGDATALGSTADGAPALRHISAEHVGSTSKWTQVMTATSSALALIWCFLPRVFVSRSA